MNANETPNQALTDNVETAAAAPAPASNPADPFDPESFKTAKISGDDSSGAKPDGTAGDKSVPVKLLVFDMGHVFVRFDWDKVCQGFCEKANLSRDTFKLVLAHVGSLGYETGKCTTENFLREMNGKMGTTLTVEEFTQLWNATFEEDLEMAKLLGDLGKKYPLYLLSNTNEVHYAHLQGNFNVARHFKELILSFQIGAAKPHRAAYQVILDRSKLTPAEVLFIDDLAVNTTAARDTVGLRTIQFVGIEDLKQRLGAHQLTW
jgi:FMN phosphatase YigB (HAD superfamily)